MSNKYKRYFNTLKVNKAKSSITKFSKRTEKLIDEINWYLKLPQELAEFTPNLIDYSKDISNPYLSLSFCKEPLLADLYVNDSLSVSEWEKVIKLLLKIQKKNGQIFHCKI